MKRQETFTKSESRLVTGFSVSSLLFAVIMSLTINPNAYAQQNHPIVGGTYSIPAAESRSIPFTIPSGVTNAYLSGTILITGGILSTIDFSIVNTDTGAVLMDNFLLQKYTDQGNIGIYIPAGSYTITFYNDSIPTGEIHTVTLTLNASY